MAFILKYRDKFVRFFDITNMDPDEIEGLKALGNVVNFNFERENKDELPPLDHDVLDDIAREAKPGDPFYDQAKQRIESLGQ